MTDSARAQPALQPTRFFELLDPGGTTRTFETILVTMKGDVLLVLLLAAQSQPPIRILNPTNPNPMPSDARMQQFDEEVKGLSWRVFAVDSPTDRVVFFLKDLRSELGDWSAVDADVAALIKAAAERLPVP